MQQLFPVLLCISIFSQVSISQCTSFCLSAGDTVLFGNTLDWHTGDGLMVVNKRNVSKTALGFDHPVKWTSKYGSISMTQWGREFPCRGMNEAGLVIGEMTLAETRFPEPDSRPAFSLEQWIQYQLDNCATVEEVLATDSIVRIDRSAYASHYFIADKSGNCATMEWLDGKLIYHTQGSLPIKALTNSTYESLIKFYDQKNPHPADDYCTLARFYRVANMLDHYDPLKNTPAREYAWSILESVNKSDRTKWMLLFDVKNRRVFFKTNTNSNVRWIDFKSFDFSCSSPVKIMEINADVSGDVQSYFKEYDYNSNLDLIRKMAELCGPITGVVPESYIQSSALYPETTMCNPERNTGR